MEFIGNASGLKNFVATGGSLQLSTDDGDNNINHNNNINHKKSMKNKKAKQINFKKPYNNKLPSWQEYSQINRVCFWRKVIWRMRVTQPFVYLYCMYKI